MFFKELSKVLDLELGGLLRAISTEAQLQGLNEKELPYSSTENVTHFSLETGIYWVVESSNKSNKKITTKNDVHRTMVLSVKLS